ncbi:MAG: hypothetical protein UY50_C0009G0011 [Parcubacteria group bacterium GW2011_GWA2_49_9]|nr:MAG: hypothetical protein UY50_C0009G0011 [Parcubacteria group bacterium GW2011_GWA2_49_9]
MTIPELHLKIKELQERLNTREIYTVLLILVVGFGSFGLGRLSKLQEGKSSIRVEQAVAAVASVPPLLSKPARTAVQSGGEGTGGVVASVKDEGLKMKDSGGLLRLKKHGRQDIRRRLTAKDLNSL